jgi:capsular polysaccharide export protein
VWHYGVWRIPHLSSLLERPVLRAMPLFYANRDWSGWGNKRSGKSAAKLAARSGGRCLRLEDGFLRSYHAGPQAPRLSLVVDDIGIYYDSTGPSALENMLASDADLLAGIANDVMRAKSLILENYLSKYNHAPLLDSKLLRTDDEQRVLLVDQTMNDLSVTQGGANIATFSTMLAAARAENPGATIYIKTHPEVSAGKKKGYLSEVKTDTHTVLLREPVNPLSLIEMMDKVYVVSSTMGFEALLAGKPVSIFGLPWYAGWGLTDDRLTCQRRQRKRTVDELFAAAYFHYTRYLDPVTHQRGSIFDVIDWLLRQQVMAACRSRLICVGFRKWKAANLKPLLSLHPEQLVFVPDAAAAQACQLKPEDKLVYWGSTPPAGLSELSLTSAARLMRIEDGFIRSVGLGSDLIAPHSLVIDESGIYFDPTQSSGLEKILKVATFTPTMLRRANQVRAFIIKHGITKYNLESRAQAQWQAEGREIILVPGQVEDDASIQLGCPAINTNLGLLQAARAAHPDGWIVYKPHPDVLSRNRQGQVATKQALQYADHIETSLSVVSCIAACDVMHTMTSLSGFDALLRNKRVIVYGLPFYAGWGLTQDILQHAPQLRRRQTQLTLDQLVAGTLLHYPLYWDWALQGYTSCEAVLHRIVALRNQLESSGGLEKLKSGFLRRQWRKISILLQALLVK